MCLFRAWHIMNHTRYWGTQGAWGPLLAAPSFAVLCRQQPAAARPLAGLARRGSSSCRLPASCGRRAAWCCAAYAHASRGPSRPAVHVVNCRGSSVTLMGAMGWISGQNLDRIKQAQCDNAEAMPTKTVHATEFALFDRPLPRPVDIMRLLAKGGLPLTMARSVVERIATRNIKARYYHESNRVYIEIARSRALRPARRRTASTLIWTPMAT